jgi:hypothetical protein
LLHNAFWLKGGGQDEAYTIAGWRIIHRLLRFTDAVQFWFLAIGYYNASKALEAISKGWAGCC